MQESDAREKKDERYTQAFIYAGMTDVGITGIGMTGVGMTDLT